LGTSILPFVADPYDRGLWAMLLVAMDHKQGDQNPLLQWNTEVINVPDHVNLDTFNWDFGQLL